MTLYARQNELKYGSGWRDNAFIKDSIYAWGHIQEFVGGLLWRFISLFYCLSFPAVSIPLLADTDRRSAFFFDAGSANSSCSLPELFWESSTPLVFATFCRSSEEMIIRVILSAICWLLLFLLVNPCKGRFDQESQLEQVKFG